MKSGKGQERATRAARIRAWRARRAQGRPGAHRSGAAALCYPDDGSCFMRFDDGHMAASPSRSAHDCAGGSPGRRGISRTKAEGGRRRREEFPRSPANNLPGTKFGDVQAEAVAPCAALPAAAPCASCSDMEPVSWTPCPTAPISAAASAGASTLMHAPWTPCSAAATEIEDPAPRTPQFAPSLSIETPPKVSAGWAGCRGPRPFDEMGAEEHAEDVLGEIDPRLGRGGESSGADAPLWPCSQCARQFRRKSNRDKHVLLRHVVPQLSKQLLPVAHPLSAEMLQLQDVHPARQSFSPEILQLRDVSIPAGGDTALPCLPCAQEMRGEGVSV